MRPDVALFAAGAALGFPRLPLRPAVSVIAGREAWERFTANGTEEDVTAARIAVDARLTEKAHRALRGRQGERTDLVDNINDVHRPTGTARAQALRRLRDSLTGAGAGAAPSASPDAEKAHRTGRCAFCEASLVGRRRHAAYCGGRCRAAGSRARRTAPALVPVVVQESRP